jgi:hypothetical protein
MRFLLFIVFCDAALWLGDALFFKRRYSNEVWRDVNQEFRKLDYEIRKWVKC